MLVQASWPTHDGTSKNAFSNETRNAATVATLRAQRDAHNSAWLTDLEAQVRKLNETVGHQAVFIVPVSNAVFALRERVAEGRAPGLNRQTDLFNDALGHPRPPLAVLVTYCHFAAIYGRSPAGLPVPAALKDNPELIPQVHVRGDVAAPWRCVAGAIYNVQISGYPTVGFISNPVDPNA